ncbi:amidase [Runella slithyformis]|uniref:Amidase n=1 Tax=Runella slithyformis (strain ATCC 29530 / DSM 19594 / LMG 11500 / NCIMB 11436 / LSU 4) TaxID=761193 RepID=A0A7U4E461_RUNSL|nr:amidase [Runella slithyformis]AEI46813.1 Amidase [Runella slithyformis DSM 19594]
MKKLFPTLLVFAACVGSFLLGTSYRSADQAITADIANYASKIFGIEFSAAERDSMLDNLNDQLKGFERVRKIPLTNDVAPALLFDPVPQGFEFEKVKKTFNAGPLPKVTLPAVRDSLAYYTVAQLGVLIRTKQISSVELTQFFLARLKKYSPALLNVITFTEDLAIAQATRADAELKAGTYRGLLHGIPYGAKDLLAKKGYPTTWGSAIYKNQQLPYDATVIQKLEKAGAVLIAKMSVGEFAWGDVWFGGMTRNPWNTKTGASGSSAGSGSAVAAGCLPFAIGTETLGSIVSPSTVNGITGLRPTFGRVSRFGAMALSWSMDKIGPMARSVEDCALIFNAILGPDGNDATVRDVPFNYEPLKTLKGMRIGYLKKAFESNYSNRANDSLTLAKLRELGAELVPFELPSYPVGDLTIAIGVEGGAAFDELTLTNKDDQMVRQGKNAWPNEFRSARYIPAIEYVQAQRVRTKMIQDLYQVLKKERFDVYITPTSAGGNLTYTNLSGHPSICLPNGFNRNSMPTSITFSAQLYNEAKMLAVAKVYQDATFWHKKHPEL